MKANDKPEVDKSIIINFLDIFMKHLNLLRKWAGEMTWWEKNLLLQVGGSEFGSPGLISEARHGVIPVTPEEGSRDRQFLGAHCSVQCS